MRSRIRPEKSTPEDGNLDAATEQSQPSVLTLFEMFKVGWSLLLWRGSALINAGQMRRSGTLLYPSHMLGKKLQRYVWWVGLCHWCHQMLFCCLSSNAAAYSLDVLCHFSVPCSQSIKSTRALSPRCADLTSWPALAFSCLQDGKAEWSHASWMDTPVSIKSVKHTFYCQWYPLILIISNHDPLILLFLLSRDNLPR